MRERTNADYLAMYIPQFKTLEERIKNLEKFQSDVLEIRMRLVKIESVLYDLSHFIGTQFPEYHGNKYFKQQHLEGG